MLLTNLRGSGQGCTCLWNDNTFTRILATLVISVVQGKSLQSLDYFQCILAGKNMGSQKKKIQQDFGFSITLVLYKVCLSATFCNINPSVLGHLGSLHCKEKNNMSIS